MIHYPRCLEDVSWMDCTESSGKGWQESWSALERLYAEGVLLAIGVANFNHQDLSELLNISYQVPHVVQNWFDPLHQDSEVRALCDIHEIVYQAYSTLRFLEGGKPHPAYTEVMKQVDYVAAKTGQTRQSVLLRWALDERVAVLARSGNEVRRSRIKRIKKSPKKSLYLS